MKRSNSVLSSQCSDEHRGGDTTSQHSDSHGDRTELDTVESRGHGEYITNEWKQRMPFIQKDQMAGDAQDLAHHLQRWAQGEKNCRYKFDKPSFGGSEPAKRWALWCGKHEVHSHTHTRGHTRAHTRSWHTRDPLMRALLLTAPKYGAWCTTPVPSSSRT